MGNFSNKVIFDELRSLNFSAISGSYTAVGNPLIFECRKVKIQNLTNNDLTISLDGVTDMDLIPSNGFALYDFVDSTNIDQQKPYLPVGTTFYVKGTPSSGDFYITVLGAR